MLTHSVDDLLELISWTLLLSGNGKTVTSVFHSSTRASHDHSPMVLTSSADSLTVPAVQQDYQQELGAGRHQ